MTEFLMWLSFLTPVLILAISIGVLIFILRQKNAVNLKKVVFLTFGINLVLAIGVPWSCLMSDRGHGYLEMAAMVVMAAAFFSIMLTVAAFIIHLVIVLDKRPKIKMPIKNGPTNLSN